MVHPSHDCRICRMINKLRSVQMHDVKYVARLIKEKLDAAL